MTAEKPAPEIVTVVPVGPLIGENRLRIGGQLQFWRHFPAQAESAGGSHSSGLVRTPSPHLAAAGVVGVGTFVIVGDTLRVSVGVGVVDRVGVSVDVGFGVGETVALAVAVAVLTLGQALSANPTA